MMTEREKLVEEIDAWLRFNKPTTNNPTCHCAGEMTCVFCSGTDLFEKVRSAFSQPAVPEWHKPETIEAAAIAIMKAQCCGCMVNGEHVLCCHPGAKDSMGRDPGPCDCLKSAAAALSVAARLAAPQPQHSSVIPSKES